MASSSEWKDPIQRDRSLEPERKLVSVLFADIRSSTALIEQLDPEDAIDRLRPALQAMREAVHRFGGIVSHERGDGIMALFGAPVAEDNHATRACRAALDIHDRLQGIGDPDLMIRVGVHSGEVVLRRVDDDLSSIYEAAGPVVHLASRLESAAEAGKTLISAACLSLTEGRFAVVPRGAIPVRGFSSPVVSYEIVGERQISRWRARAATGLTAFVGRDAELRDLKAAAARAATGQAQVVVIEGEPGTGKSRLAHELLDHCLAAGWLALEAGGEAAGQAAPWQAIRQLLTSGLPGPAATSGQELAAQIRRDIGSADEHEQHAIDTIANLPVSAPAWRDAEAGYRRRIIQDVAARAIVARAGSGPTIILVDDQHWLDAESLDALHHLEAAIAGRPVLLLFTRRPRPDRDRQDGATTLRLSLGPLDEAAAQALFENLVGRDPGVAGVRQRLLAHTGGVPLFLEEVVRRLADTGALQGGIGSYTPVGPIEDLGIPPTVQGVIAARIDRLAAETRAVLQMAAVLGSRLRLGELQALAELDAGVLRRHLRDLHRAALLTIDEAGDAARLDFAHDLVHEVAYGGMVRERRRSLHARAFAGLSALYAGSESEHAAALYRHANEAARWPEAAAYARTAAARAIEVSAYRQAARYYEGALRALGHQEKTRETTEREIDIRLEARLAYGATAELDRLLAHATEAEAAARRIGDRRRALVASIHKASALNYLGSASEAVATSRSVLAAAEAAGVPQLALLAQYIAGQALYAAGAFRGAATLLAPACEQLAGPERLARMGTTGTTLVLFQVMRAVAHASMGEFRAAESCVAGAAELAAETGRPYDNVASGYAGGVTWLYQGATDRAVAVMEPALETLRQHEIRLFFPVLAGQLGAAYATAGQPSQAVALLREALVAADELGHVAARAATNAYLAAVLLRLGQVDEAAGLAESGYLVARQQGYRGVQVPAGRLLAAAKLLSGDNGDSAEALLGESIALAGEIEAYPNLAHGRLALAELYLQRGAGPARELIEAAMQAYQAMGMTKAHEAARQQLERLR